MNTTRIHDLRNLTITAWCDGRQSPLNKMLKRKEEKQEEKRQKKEVKLPLSRCHIASIALA